jgi:hypothetical protein
MTCKRGAQFGNKNAYKHGFYAKEFKASERRALSEMSTADLNEEIDAMRVHFLRFLEFDNGQAKGLDYKTQLSKLRAIGLYMGCMASLVRTQNGEKSALEQEIQDALNELRGEMGID